MISTRRQFLGSALALGAGAFGGESALGKQDDGVLWLTPTDKGFAAAKSTYNSTIQLTPAIIARCKNESGVGEALARAVAEKMPVAIKSGGHNFEGFCLNDGGLVVDVSKMNSMRLDPKTGILTAGAGCRLAEVNQYLLKQGRLLPAGSCATVGLSGLTLGGGYGMFARQFGLTCDHLLSLRMVDGQGKVRDTEAMPELLWACRGGGNGHFGVVTEMKFKTQVAPKNFRAAKFRMNQLNEAKATELLQAWFEVSADLTNNAFSAFVLNGSFLTVLATTTGQMEHVGMAAFIKRLKQLGMDQSNALTVPVAKALPRYYGEPGPVAFKNGSGGYYGSFADLAPALPGILNELLTVPGLIFQVNTLGGEIAQGPDSAYPHRAYPWLGEWQSYWEHESRREAAIAGAGRIRGHLEKAGITRHYANYPDKAFKNWSSAYYDLGYRRLQKLKRELDPNNLIRHPQSVRV